MSAGDITVLEARVRRDIEMTAHPRMDWMEPRLYRGQPALDVLIVGAGQSGLCIAFALIRDRVRNILVIDRAQEGREGIWASRPDPDRRMARLFAMVPPRTVAAGAQRRCRHGDCASAA